MHKWRFDNLRMIAHVRRIAVIVYISMLISDEPVNEPERDPHCNKRNEENDQHVIPRRVDHRGKIILHEETGLLALGSAFHLMIDGFFELAVFLRAQKSRV